MVGSLALSLAQVMRDKPSFALQVCQVFYLGGCPAHAPPIDMVYLGMSQILT